jgi:hypothetical protein
MKLSRSTIASLYSRMSNCKLPFIFTAKNLFIEKIIIPLIGKHLAAEPA